MSKRDHRGMTKTNEERLNRKQDMADQTKRVKRRELAILLIFCACAIYLIGRLAYLQIVMGEEYSRMAYIGQTRQRLIKPKRGSIYDRNGKSLAISAMVDTVSSNPKQLAQELAKKPEMLGILSSGLAEILEMDSTEVLARLTSGKPFEYIKRKVDKETGDAVRALLDELNIGAVYVDEDSKRFYPNGDLASQVLGFTGVDDQGLMGLEMQLDDMLKGQPGKILDEVDVNGNPIRFSEGNRVDTLDGYDVYLTIDETIQHYTEEALKKTVEVTEAKYGASALAIDPNTGEILSMASYPDFDPNVPDAIPEWYEGSDWMGFESEAHTKLLWETSFRNKVVMDTYEPGSTFKTITAAAALEEGLVNANTEVVCKPIPVADYTINCYRAGGHGEETFREAVYNSCNPVFVKVAQQLGIERFYQYVRMFGLQERTGIELSGEPSDDVFRSLWHANPAEIDLAVSSFGQRFQVSPMQMITAYTAIANGGNLMKPYLVRQISDADGNVVQKNEPQVIRKVISQETSDMMSNILEGVVSEGTGKNAYISGYRMAGKTGTSETVDTKTEGRYVVSFVSFAPADDPKVCLLITVDFPQVDKDLISGGGLVAPAAGKLMEQILEYKKVERKYTQKDVDAMMKIVAVPKFSKTTVEAARTAATPLGLKIYSVAGDAETPTEEQVIVRQFPEAGTNVPKTSTIYVYTVEDMEPEMTTVPDLSGMGIAQATELLMEYGLNILIIGTGDAALQSFAAGTVVEKGTVIDVEFRQNVSD